MSNASDIERRLAQILASLPELADVEAYILGMPYDVPTEYDLYVVVVVDTEVKAGEMTGNRVNRQYQGAVIINARRVDYPDEVEPGIFTLPSHRLTQERAASVVSTLLDDANHNLGSLTFSNGRVVSFNIGTQAIEYGISYLQDRLDAYGDAAIIPFECVAVEAM